MNQNMKKIDIYDKTFYVTLVVVTVVVTALFIISEKGSSDAGIVIKGCTFGEPNDPNEPNEIVNTTIIIDPNDFLDTAAAGDFIELDYATVVSFCIGSFDSMDEVSFSQKDESTISCDSTLEKFIEILPYSLYSMMNYSEPNGTIVIEWADPNEAEE